MFERFTVYLLSHQDHAIFMLSIIWYTCLIFIVDYSACNNFYIHCYLLEFEPPHEKTCFFIYENKDAVQLCSNCAAEQGLRLPYTDSTMPLLHKSEVSRL